MTARRHSAEIRAALPAGCRRCFSSCVWSCFAPTPKSVLRIHASQSEVSQELPELEVQSGKLTEEQRPPACFVRHPRRQDAIAVGWPSGTHPPKTASDGPNAGCRLDQVRPSQG